MIWSSGPLSSEALCEIISYSVSPQPLGGVSGKLGLKALAKVVKGKINGKIFCTNSTTVKSAGHETRRLFWLDLWQAVESGTSIETLFLHLTNSGGLVLLVSGNGCYRRISRFLYDSNPSTGPESIGRVSSEFFDGCQTTEVSII